MSFLQELCAKKKSLKSSDTVLTLPDGRRFLETKNNPTQQIPSINCGFVVDLKPDNVPAKIVENLYIGSQDCCEFEVLQKYNIKHVLSVGIEPTYKFEGVNYTFAECLDLPETDIKKVLIEVCIPIIKFSLENNSNILVHCNAGVSRSSAVAIGFLMLDKRMSYQEAFAKVKEARSCINPNSGFINQLKFLTSLT